MAVGSSFLADLNAGDDTPGNVSYTSIATRLDEVVFPYRTAFLANDGNISNVAVQDDRPGPLEDHRRKVMRGCRAGMSEEHPAGAALGTTPMRVYRVGTSSTRSLERPWA